MVSLILVVGFASYWKYLTFQSFFIFTKEVGTADTWSQYWPVFHYMASKIHGGEGIPGWTFSLGIGTNIFAIKKTFLDPFHLLSYAFGPNSLPYTFGYITLLKTIVAGLGFYLYAGLFRISGYARVVGGLLYAFNGYMTLRGIHYHFGTLVAFIPFFFWGLELLFQRKNFWMFPLLVCFFSAMNFYYFYMGSIFLFFYVGGRLLFLFRKDYQNLCKAGLWVVGLYILGLGMGAALSLPFIDYLTSSPRSDTSLMEDVTIIYSFQYYVMLFLRGISNNMIATSPTEFVNSPIYHVFPKLYMGMILPLLISQIFRPSKMRPWFIATIILFVLFLCLPLFTVIFNGMIESYHRWTIFLIFILATFASCGLDEVLKDKGKTYKTGLISVFCIIIGTLLLIIFNPTWFELYIQHNLWILIPLLLFFFLYAVGLFFVSNRSKRVFKILLLVLLCMELSFSTWLTVQYAKSPVTKKNVENALHNWDFPLESIKSYETDSPFYRISNTSGFLRNSPMINNFYSNGGFVSLHQPSYLEVMRTFFPEYPENVLVLTNSDLSNAFVDSFLGIKYRFSKKNYYYHYFQLLMSGKPFNIYINPFAFPLGFTFDTFMRQSVFEKLSTEEKNQTLVQTSILGEDVYTDLALSEITEFDQLVSLSRDKQIAPSPPEDSDNNTSELVFQLERTYTEKDHAELSISFPFKLTDVMSQIEVLGFDAQKNSWENIDFINRSSLLQSKLQLQNNLSHFSELKVVPTADSNASRILNGVTLTETTFDTQTLTTIAKQKWDEGFKIDTFKDDHITGSISLQSPEILTFSIPYDKGWHVWVNGKKHEFERVSIGFLGLYLDAGDHTVELKYRPPGLLLGSVISAISFICFGMLVFFTNRRKKKH